MLKLRRSLERLIFNMGIPILVKQHLYIETAPRHYIIFKLIELFKKWNQFWNFQAICRKWENWHIWFHYLHVPVVIHAIKWLERNQFNNPELCKQGTSIRLISNNRLSISPNGDLIHYQNDLRIPWCPTLRFLSLTHLSLDKMAAISQTMFWNTFLWMKSFVFRSKFHWSLFLRVQLTIS